VKLIISAIALTMLTSCNWLYSPIPKSFSSRKPHSTTVTARGDKWMLTSIDLELQREKRGERPPSAKRTWREYWDWRRSLWRKQKSAKQYDEYLARKRKELGLADVRRL
jgi:hypothetical protein